LLARWGFQGTAAAAIVALVLFFWTWLFFDAGAVRGSVIALAVSPEICVAEWFGGYGRAGIPAGFFDRLPIFFTLGLILAGCIGPGSLLVDLLTRPGAQNRVEHAVLSLGVGLNLASTFVLAGGLVPGALHQTWWILAGLLVGLFLSPLFVLRLLRQQPAAHPAALGTSVAESPQPSTWSERYGAWLLVPFCLVYLFGGLLPPWDFDVREYHLQAPKEWLQRGQIDFLPHNVYANMPLGAELHAITATTLLGGNDDAWWLGGLTGKAIVSLFAPLTAFLLWCIGRRSGYASVGLAAALVYLSLPWVAHVSLHGLNDAVLGFYLLSAWWVWFQSDAADARTGSRRALMLAGYLAGAAAAVKYPAALFIVLPLVVETILRKLHLRGRMAPGSMPGNRFVQTAIALALLAIGGLAGGGLWYAKNQVQTGNPVYPLLASRLGGETRTAEKDARWTRAHAVPQDAAGRRFTLSQFFGGLRAFLFRGNLASPLLLPLLVFGVWKVVSLWRGGGTTPTVRFALLSCGALGFVVIAWFLVTHRIERFLVPILPLAALLAGWGYLQVKEQTGSTPARLFLFVGLLYSWLLVSCTGIPADARWFVALDYLRTDPLVAAERGVPLPQRLSPAERWLNEHLGPDDSVLLVGGARAWDIDGSTKRPNVYYNTCFDDCLLVDWLAGKTAAEQRQALEERGVKYVFIDWSELRRYRSPGNYGYDPRFSASLVSELIRNRVLAEQARFGEEIKSKNNKRLPPPQQIYRVLTSAEAADAAATAVQRAGQKAATKNMKPTPQAAPPTSASQSKKSG
jgi:4-amino-4-deoxy-L-arabinose transferase-like glycosyltransferase